MHDHRPRRRRRQVFLDWRALCEQPRPAVPPCSTEAPVAQLANPCRCLSCTVCAVSKLWASQKIDQSYSRGLPHPLMKHRGLEVGLARRRASSNRTRIAQSRHGAGCGRGVREVRSKSHSAASNCACRTVVFDHGSTCLLIKKERRTRSAPPSTHSGACDCLSHINPQPSTLNPQPSTLNPELNVRAPGVQDP